MIILNNKTYCRSHDGIMYDIHYNTIKAEPVIDGLVCIDIVPYMGVSVCIDFYGDSWDEDMTYAYVDRIMSSVKVLEPELYSDIYKVVINKFDV